MNKSHTINTSTLNLSLPERAYLKRRDLVLGLLALALTFFAVPAIASAGDPDASSARWSALGEYYAAKREAGEDVRSARWSALGAFYAAKYEVIAAETSSARYNALAGYYGFEPSLAASSDPFGGYRFVDDPVNGAWNSAQAEFFAAWPGPVSGFSSAHFDGIQTSSGSCNAIQLPGAPVEC